ncbi:unnamed protein product [Cochlearia groenlandica]
MDMLKSLCFYFILIVYVIVFRSCLCDSRRLGPMEKKLDVNLDHLSVKSNEVNSKLEASSTNKTKTLSNKAPIQHVVVNNGHEIKGKRTKEVDRKVKRGSLDKVSRTWKIPKYTKKQPRSYQEHPGFNLDYMQPTMHPPHHN